MNYYITHDRESVNNAGSKAPADINRLCDDMGWQPYEIRTVSRRANRALRYLNILTSCCRWSRITRTAKKNEAVLYQHPMYSGTQIARRFLKKLNEKGVLTIVLIHDLEHLRSDNSDDSMEKNELQFIDSFTKIIAHNPSMRSYLVKKGMHEEKIVCLNAFDYITPGDIEEHKAVGELSVAVAGNLDRKKCSYIYEFAEMNPELSVNLYGGNYDNKTVVKNICYKGSFRPDELPSVLEEKYGLIWDGNTLDECSGTMGNYLRYNNPHKLSLYITAGIPVIVWEKSAVAGFVAANNCGIMTDDLFDLKKRLEKISSEEYRRMKSSCIELSIRMRKGYFFRDALRRCGIPDTGCKRAERC